MAPHHQWAYTKQKGTHWYQSRPEDYAHLYRFVRRNAELFDDYEAVAPVGLLYSSAGVQKSSREARDAALALAHENVPFELVMAGDAWLPARLTPETLGKYRALVVAGPTLLEGEQKKALDAFAAAGKVVAWDAQTGIDSTRLTRLTRLLPRPIAFPSGENLVAIARAIPARPDAPVVVHLLNRNYDPAADAVKTLRNVRMTLHQDLFGGRSFTRATLYAPPSSLDRSRPGASEPLPLGIEPTDHGTTIVIPQLDLWGIVKLQ